MKIIALSGKRGSGKSTLAGYLTTYHGYAKFSFAEELRKEVTAAGFTGHYTKPTPEHLRKLLIAWGLARREHYQAYWVDKLFDTLGEYNQLRRSFDLAGGGGETKVVIDDLRFRNEAFALRERGAVLVRIEIDDPLHRQGFVPGVDDDASEVDLDDWAFNQGWDLHLKAKYGKLHHVEPDLDALVEEMEVPV